MFLTINEEKDQKIVLKNYGPKAFKKINEEKQTRREFLSSKNPTQNKSEISHFSPESF